MFLKWQFLMRKLRKYWIILRLKSSRKRDRLARGLINDCTEYGLSVENRKAEQLERCQEKLIGKTDNPHKVMEHFGRLKTEIDPLEGEKEIQQNSVKSINANIPISSDGMPVVFEDNRANRKRRRS